MRTAANTGQGFKFGLALMVVSLGLIAGLAGSVALAVGWHQYPNSTAAACWPPDVGISYTPRTLGAWAVFRSCYLTVDRPTRVVEWYRQHKGWYGDSSDQWGSAGDNMIWGNSTLSMLLVKYVQVAHWNASTKITLSLGIELQVGIAGHR